MWHVWTKLLFVPNNQFVFVNHKINEYILTVALDNICKLGEECKWSGNRSDVFTWSARRITGLLIVMDVLEKGNSIERVLLTESPFRSEAENIQIDLRAKLQISAENTETSERNLNFPPAGTWVTPRPASSDQRRWGAGVFTSRLQRSAEQIRSRSRPQGPINNESGQESVSAFMTSAEGTERKSLRLFLLHCFTS